VAEGGKYLVGRHDGTTAICLSADLAESSTDSVTLKNLTPCGDFDEFLRVYLQALEKDSRPTSLWNNKEFFIFAGLLPCLLLPMPSSAATIRSTDLVLTDKFETLGRFSYVGEMHSDIAIRAELPPDLQSILAQLKSYEPVVEIPAEVLSGAPITKLRLRIREHNLNDFVSIREQLGRRWSKRCEIPHGSRLNDSDYRLHNWDHAELSAEWVRCNTAGEIWCTRIGYFDLANKQTRALTLRYFVPDRQIELLKQRFKVLNGPYSAEQKLSWHERLLSAHIPGSGLVYNLVEGFDKCVDIGKDVIECLGDLTVDLAKMALARLRGKRVEA
jgi:hypothetical protein